MALQGSWPFSEGSGTTAADTSGNNRTAMNVPGWTSDGHTGDALLGNGAAAGASVVVSSDFNAYATATFMCWVYLAGLPGAGQDIIRGPRLGSSGVWSVRVASSGIVSVQWGDGAITGTTLVTNTWYHIALAFDWNGSAVLYVNGSPAGTGVGKPLQAGTLYWGGYDLPLNGRIDDARWYDTQLNQAAIQTLMNTPVAGVLESSGTTRFMKAASGEWLPVRTQRVVNPAAAGMLYGWQLTVKDAGLSRHGINGDNLPEYTGSTKPAAGATIIGKKITTGLDLSNGNITIDRCYVRPVDSTGSVLVTYDFNATAPGNGPVTIRDCTIDGSGLTTQQAAFSLGIQAYGTITGNYITGLGSGIGVMGINQYDDTLIEGNYVDNLLAWGDPATTGNHSDAFTIRDYSAATVPSRQIVVRNNRFDCSSGNDTGACFIQTFSGDIDNVTIQGNLLEGGGYNFGLAEMNGNHYSNLTVTNNRFRPTGFGAANRGNGVGFTVWTNNYLDNPGQPDHIGAAVLAP